MKSDAPSIVHRLLQHMREQEYRVNDRLPSIRHLAKTLNVSPNIVRDGIREAQTKGVIRIVPRSGTFVQSLDYSSFVEALDQTLETALFQRDPNLIHLIEARCTIEIQTVAMATLRHRPEDLALLREIIDEFDTNRNNQELRIFADERFHLQIATIAGNLVLVTILRAILTLLRPYRLAVSLSESELEKSHREHENMYRAIDNGDLTSAGDFMNLHISTHLQTISARYIVGDCALSKTSNREQ